MPELRSLPRREIPARPLNEREQVYFNEWRVRICPTCNLPEGSWLHRARPEPRNEWVGRWWDRDAHAFGAPVPVHPEVPGEQ